MQVNRQAVIRNLQQFNDGAGVITVTQFSKFLGMKSWEKAKKKLEGLPAFEGKYYMVTDVADLWIRNLEEASG